LRASAVVSEALEWHSVADRAYAVALHRRRLEVETDEKDDIVLYVEEGWG